MYECAIELLQHPYYYLKSKMVEFMLIIHFFFVVFYISVNNTMNVLYLLCNPADVDECNDTQLNNCSENATCENGIGNYSCECNEGYEGNGFNCSGECAIELLQHPYYYLESKMVEFMLIIHCLFCCFLHLCEQHNERFISSV